MLNNVVGPDADTVSQDYLQSSFREKLIEHLLVGELLKLSWLRGDCALEIAKPEVDRGGYDLVAEHNQIVRHIQLKASKAGAKASGQKVQLALMKKPAGCVVWTVFDEATLGLGPFLFFGSEPGVPLPDLGAYGISRHTKANVQGRKAERPGLRVVPKSQFTSLATIEALWGALFGSPAV